MSVVCLSLVEYSLVNKTLLQLIEVDCKACNDYVCTAICNMVHKLVHVFYKYMYVLE